ncbi:MAG: coenzyme F420-0:L-glutamate ligase [Nitrososphaerota archaeon]|nr:coenzyme F420-0:L-glutamate ligase [Nitrososphaerota archaeon]MDG6979322.1 coenzyme F420-0:L-glutamate ligase [Nitrososphaerota archaeon]
MPASEVRVIPVRGIGRVARGDDLVETISRALSRGGVALEDGDIVVVTQKVVSKSEGRLVRLEEVSPTRRARSIAVELKKDPRLVELVLRESKRVVRKGQGVLITETLHGFVCANSGIDMSNVEEGHALLLPVDPDLSARRLRRRLEKATGRRLAVVVTDTFGRPWRTGQTDVAIGCSGIAPTVDLSGRKDPYGHVLRVTQPALVDEVAAASELVMGKLSMVPVSVVRGVSYARSEAGVRSLVLEGRLDLFR